VTNVTNAGMPCVQVSYTNSSAIPYTIIAFYFQSCVTRKIGISKYTSSSCRPTHQGALRIEHLPECFCHTCWLCNAQLSSKVQNLDWYGRL